MKFKGNAKSDTSKVFPEGDYFLTCVHVQDKDKEGNDLLSKKGNSMWVLEFAVAEGPHKDRRVFHHLVFIPEGKPGHGMPLGCIKGFGYDPEGDIDIQPAHLKDLTIKAKVKIEEQDGYEPQNKIARFYKPDGELRKLAALAEPGSSSAAPGTDFDPKKLEQESATDAGQQGQAPAKAPARKPLWGGGARK